MVKSHRKRCTSQIIQEIQIKTTIRYHLIPVGITTIKKTTNKKCWQRYKREPLYIPLYIPTWWECKLVQPLWKILWRFLKKLKIELSYDPEILLLGIYLIKTKTPIQKDKCTAMSIGTLFTIAKIQNQPNYPLSDEWIKKMWYLYTMEHYSDISKNEMPFVATRMQLEIIILSELNQINTNII